jgi:hypothetical protein
MECLADEGLAREHAGGSLSTSQLCTRVSSCMRMCHGGRIGKAKLRSGGLKGSVSFVAACYPLRHSPHISAVPCCDRPFLVVERA